MDYLSIKIAIPRLLERASSTIYDFHPERGFTFELGNLFYQLQNYWFVTNFLTPELVEINRIECNTYEFFEFTELIDDLNHMINLLKIEIEN